MHRPTAVFAYECGAASLSPSRARPPSVRSCAPLVRSARALRSSGLAPPPSKRHTKSVNVMPYSVCLLLTSCGGWGERPWTACVISRLPVSKPGTDARPRLYSHAHQQNWCKVLLSAGTDNPPKVTPNPAPPPRQAKQPQRRSPLPQREQPPRGKGLCGGRPHIHLRLHERD